MAAPVSLLNSVGQRLDVIVRAAGGVRYKLGIGSKDISGIDSGDGAWQGVASHEDAATFAASDGVVVGAGVDDTNTVRKLAVDADGLQLVRATGASGAVTDGSGTIASGGDSQSLFAINANRRYLFIQNLDDAEDLWINFTDDADIDTEGSIRLGPWAAFESGNFVSTEAVKINAATTSHKFTAKEA